MSTNTPMSTLAEMLEIAPIVEEASVSRIARSVYHRDYVKTKNKSYRKYDPDDYKKHKSHGHKAEKSHD